MGDDLPISILLDFPNLFSIRGSQFLKDWMEFLEENADLRYPDAGDFI